MAFEHREGSGALFHNQHKKEDKHPDYRGDIKINGKVLEIVGWRKETQSGDSFLSLKVSEKREAPQETAEAKRGEFF